MPQGSEVAVSLFPMNLPDSTRIEARVQEIGQQVFRRPKFDFLNKNFWYTKMLELSTSDPRVKTQLFRFVDVLPVLQSVDQKKAHLLEYLSAPNARDSWPLSLRLISSIVSVPALSALVVKLSDFQVQKMAQNFILGDSLAEVLPKLLRSRSRGIGFTLDILGEAVLSEDEAKVYQAKYLKLIEEIGREAKSWPKVPLLDDSPLGPIPPVNISIKISSLDPRMDPAAFEVSLSRLITRLEPILRAAVKQNIFINFDMEQFALKDLTRELFKRLVSKPEFRAYRFFGVVVQAYLKSSLADVEDWVAFSRERRSPLTIRLVKGAYWDYEVINADQNTWEAPVFLKKHESDENYEACTRALLEAYPAIEMAAGSHNLRSISYALSYAEALQLPKNALEVQMLYGMADSFKESLVKMGVRVREYDPIGEMLPGLSYLVRRLLENTSNDSFLKQSFMNNTGIHELLKNPQLKPQ